MPRPEALVRPAAVAGVVLAWWLLGPLVAVVALAGLAVPRVRRWLRPSVRAVALGAAVVAVLAAGLWWAPDGRLPVPSGSGAWVTPGYTGRPVLADAVETGVPVHPHLAPVPAAGPTGLSVEVSSRSYAGEHCRPAPGPSGLLVAACAGPAGHRLRVVDPEGLHPRAGKDLRGGCPLPHVVGDRGRVLVADGRRLLAVDTADGSGEPDLTTAHVVDLGDAVPAGECLVSVLPDHDGRAWFAASDGQVGFVPGSGPPRLRPLGERVHTGFAAGPDGAVYLTTDAALYRLRAGRSGPVVDWRTAYDVGSGTKSGQDSPGSGSGPTWLPGSATTGGPLVAFTDNANPRMHVVAVRAVDGTQVCRAEVFEDDASATRAPLVPLAPTAVVVTNTHGYDSPWRTVLGRRPAGGLARVDVARCAADWVSAEAAPSSVPVLAPATGLLHAVTKRRSLLLADAWYLTALDATTGRTAWSARLGRGVQYDPAGSAVALGADGSAYVGTLGGLVRVTDRR